MKELMDNILATEKEAEKIVENARKQAIAIKTKANEKINNEKASLKIQTRESIAEASKTARDCINKMKVPSLPENRAELLKELGINQESFLHVVNAVNDILTKPYNDDNEKNSLLESEIF
jgi:F0F1-type ATP synthase membrane subunit b/b'